ncbi:phage tail protein [Flavobacterium luminosum]|uniref:Tail fiber protein n=1 Tax=Flavobacterium luminosum TaxID=2949086 RepID=A0ABT0TKV7_9FLAO|nr:tail fiber protein [Flavobacterium sp. HXWNR70]MCL9808130.1 tail fiber protein [Flavobacterium sp. HXWNR70]
MKNILKIFLFVTLFVNSNKLFSQDGSQYLGEIQMFAGNYAPKGWALCQGQLLPINQNQALFSLLGTTYGGNGTTTFALPDLRSRVPIHVGNGYSQGLFGGTEYIVLTINNLPSHSHTVNAVNTAGNQNLPTDNLLADTLVLDPEYSNALPNSEMNSAMVSNVGANQPMNNMQPYLVINYIICLQGVYPSAN